MHLYINMIFSLILLLSLLNCQPKNVQQTQNETELIENNTMKINGNTINPNAQINCKGASIVNLFEYNNQKIIFDLKNTEVMWVFNETTQQSQLQVWMDNFSDQDAAYFLKFILTGATSPIAVDQYRFLGSPTHNVKGFLLLNDEVVDTFDENATGYLTIDGYGFSSNIVCGTIVCKSAKGTIFEGRFNTILSSY